MVEHISASSLLRLSGLYNRFEKVVIEIDAE